MLTIFDDDALIYGALRAGAAGFLLKNASPEDLVRAVRAVAAGEGVIAAYESGFAAVPRALG